MNNRSQQNAQSTYNHCWKKTAQRFLKLLLPRSSTQLQTCEGQQRLSIMQSFKELTKNSAQKKTNSKCFAKPRQVSVISLFKKSLPHEKHFVPILSMYFTTKQRSNRIGSALTERILDHFYNRNIAIVSLKHKQKSHTALCSRYCPGLSLP